MDITKRLFGPLLDLGEASWRFGSCDLQVGRNSGERNRYMGLYVDEFEE